MRSSTFEMKSDFVQVTIMFIEVIVAMGGGRGEGDELLRKKDVLFSLRGTAVVQYVYFAFALTVWKND